MNKLILQEFSHNDWAGVLFQRNKLKASTFLVESREGIIDYLSQFINGSFVIEESSHFLLDLIKKIRYGEYCLLPKKIDFDFSGYTEKEVKVLKVVSQIPFGETVSYGEVARRAGLGKAARFVGTVMRKNRFAPLIPCHRVIRSDGKVGNYSARSRDPEEGSRIKKLLIEQEKRKKV